MLAAAGSRVSSNSAASTSAAARKQNEQTINSSPAITAPADPRFRDAVGRESPGVAQVALDPVSMPLLDLNAATFSGGDPNRIRLADLILNDGKPPPVSRFLCVLVPVCYCTPCMTICITMHTHRTPSMLISAKLHL